ncbi:hypothetical protein HJFPF1_07391 [Paramyrothecium foliicola]|nr:hypothetical protein HJFPF1_07391 [Paramyrothecium foliicola]
MDSWSYHPQPSSRGGAQRLGLIFSTTLPRWASAFFGVIDDRRRAYSSDSRNAPRRQGSALEEPIRRNLRLFAVIASRPGATMPGNSLNAATAASSCARSVEPVGRWKFWL